MTTEREAEEGGASPCVSCLQSDLRTSFSTGQADVTRQLTEGAQPLTKSPTGQAHVTDTQTPLSGTTGAF